MRPTILMDSQVVHHEAKPRPGPRCFGVDPTFLGSSSSSSQLSPTLPLCCEQPSSDHVQIGERRSDFQPMQVLCQTAVARLAEAEDVVDHPEHGLDPGAQPRLIAILRLLDLVDLAVVAIPLFRADAPFRRNWALCKRLGSQRAGAATLPSCLNSASIVNCTSSLTLGNRK